MDVVEVVRVVVWMALGAEEELWRLLPSRHKYADCKAPFRRAGMLLSHTRAACNSQLPAQPCIVSPTTQAEASSTPSSPRHG